MTLDLSVTGIKPKDYPELFRNIQGNILASHGRNHARHIFVTFECGKESEVKEWINNFTDVFVTSAAAQEAQSAMHKFNPCLSKQLFAGFYLSSLAYTYLGYGLSDMPGDTSFRQGMANASLGDPSVKKWQPGFNSKNIHALILLAMNDDIILQQYANYFQNQLESIATIQRVQSGFVMRNDNDQVIEHFGFVDGVSNPQFLDRQQPTQSNKFNESAPLSLVLTKDPQAGDYGYGSYVVYRKLQQDVESWNKEVVALAEDMGIEPDLAGAYAVGRFQDGTPVSESDKAQNSNPVPNNFNFDEDPNGVKCPFHAHIRKSNPRGQTVERFPGTTLESERNHRIARRAISYDDTFVAGDTDEGLLFICMQSSIIDQFEFMQRSWCNANHFIQQNVGQDTVIGQGSQVPEVGQLYPNPWGEEPQEGQRFDFKLFVQMQGGEYFFAPSIEFLTNLK